MERLPNGRAFRGMYWITFRPVLSMMSSMLTALCTMLQANCQQRLSGSEKRTFKQKYKTSFVYALTYLFFHSMMTLKIKKNRIFILYYVGDIAQKFRPDHRNWSDYASDSNRDDRESSPVYAISCLKRLPWAVFFIF